jgi:hypothetical protein
MRSVLSKNDVVDVQKGIDANAAYLRDCIIKGNTVGAIKAETNLKFYDIELAVNFEGVEQ